MKETGAFPSRRDLIRKAAALPLAMGGASFVSASLAAQAFPSRVVTIVVPYPPGGVTDYAARPLATFLTEKFGKPVVVENRAGAGGGIGHTQVARAEPDGHTIMAAIPSLAVIPEANRMLGRPVTYEASDFVPLARMFADPSLVWVKADAKWRTIHELMDDIKKEPGRIAYSSSGVFGTSHLAMEMLLHAAGLRMLHVPYQGGAPAINALLSDQVAVLPTVLSNFKGLYESGKVRPLVQFGERRLSAFPDLPTCQEIGYKDVVFILWTGLFAPAKTPVEAQQILRAGIRDFMNKPGVADTFRAGGTEVSYQDAAEFAKFLDTDNARLIAVTREIKLGT